MNDFLNEQSKAWCDFAQQCKVVPSIRPHVKGAEKAILFRIINIESLPIPKVLVDKSEKSKDSVQLHLSATLFDTKAKGKDEGSYLGNTWTGERKGLQECSTPKTGVKDVKWNKRDSFVRDVNFGSDYGFVFYTTQNVDDLRVVVECVATICEDKDGPREEYGICWCSFQIDSSEKAGMDLQNPVAVKIDAVYFGTPRFLLFTEANQSQLKKARIEHASASFFSVKRDDLKQVALHLMVENELCGGGDPRYGAIPGLISSTGPTDSTETKSIRGFVPLISSLSILEEFEISFDETSFQFPYNFEKRLRSDILPVIKGIENVRIELFMDVGVHNGRRFVGKSPESPCLNEYQIIELEKIGDDGYKAGRICLNHCMADSLISIIVLLRAKIKSEDAVSNICVGWIPIVPWRDNELVLGTYKVHLLSSTPFVSVSKLLTFQKGGMMDPIVLTTTLRCEGRSGSIDINQSIKKATLPDHAVASVFSEKLGNVQDQDDGIKSTSSTSDGEASEIEPVPETPFARRAKIERTDSKEGRGDSSVLPEKEISTVFTHVNDATHAESVRDGSELRGQTPPNEASVLPSTTSTSAPIISGHLQKIRLKCYLSSGVSEVDQISIESSWNEVLNNNF